MKQFDFVNAFTTQATRHERTFVACYTDAMTYGIAEQQQSRKDLAAGAWLNYWAPKVGELIRGCHLYKQQEERLNSLIRQDRGYEWMKWVWSNGTHLSDVINRINDYRQTVAPGTPDDDRWGRMQAATIVDQIIDKTKRMMAQLTPEDRRERLRKRVEEYAKQAHWNDAVATFEAWVDAHDHPARLAAAWLSQSHSDALMEKVRQAWIASSAGG